MIAEGDIGPVERSVLADLSRLGKLDEGVRGSLAQMALRLAQAYDAYDGEDPGKLSRLNQELRQTLKDVAEVGDDDDGRAGDAARMSTPVRDASDAGPADVGAAHGGDSAAVG
jgi:hypothetical protein